ncbi:hypothetical protein [Bradyrhizobium sp.]
MKAKAELIWIEVQEPRRLLQSFSRMREKVGAGAPAGGSPYEERAFI